MSPKKRRSQKIPSDVKTNMKIDDFFHQMSDKQCNDASTPRKKMDSRHGPKDITNTRPQGPEDQSTSPDKIIHIALDGEHREHVLRCRDRDSLYMGLNSLQAVKEKMEAQKGKEMLVFGKEGIDGCINLGMPLCCFPENSHVEIKFIQSKCKLEEGKKISGRHDESAIDCVKFYIHAIGKGKKKVVRSGHLHKEGCKLCVYAPKGETIKDALCKDGRFLPLLERDDWKLIENLDSILENTHLVDDLEGRLFEVELVSRKRKRSQSSAPQNAESEQRSTLVLKQSIVEQYPSFEREREKVNEKFKEEMKEIRKKANGRKVPSLFTLHKTNFGKVTKNSTLAITYKLLSPLIDSVGYLCWDNNGLAGCATCFVFKGLYICTCRHVINDIVGEGIDVSNWPDIISRCAKVTFGYQNQNETPDYYFSIEPWFEISDSTLDYAILKLQENRQEVPRELYYEIASAPLSGLIYIIGHPDGKPRSVDACEVIPQGQRREKSMQNLQATAAEFCSNDSQFIHMFTQRSFEEIVLNTDTITYSTCFYGGSSGSPVFDSRGFLVAMHTGGFTPDYQGRHHHIIEFGSSMQSILNNIKQRYEVWFTEVCVNQQDVHMDSASLEMITDNI